MTVPGSSNWTSPSKWLSRLSVVIVLLASCHQDRRFEFHDGWDFRMPLEIAVATAARIAVIDVSDREQVKIGNRICGFRYSAAVVEQYKGGIGSFTFFSGLDEPGLQTPGRHFIIAYRPPAMTPELKEFLALVTARDESGRLSCWTEADVFVPVFSHTLWQFNSDAANRLGGEWIGPPSGPDVRWCRGDETRPFSRALVSGHFRSVNIGSQSAPQIVYEWQTVKRLVDRALRNSPYPSGISPTWATPVRDDMQWDDC